MPSLARVTTVIAFALISAASAAVAKPPATRPADQPSPILSEVKVDKQLPLNQFVASLRQADPDLQIVLAGSETEAERVYVPAMRLKNVSIDQVLQLLQNTCPGLQVSQIEQGPQPVYVLTPPGEHTPRADNLLQVFPLGDAVDRLAMRSARGGQVDEKAQRQALDAVLSLIKAAAEKADTDAPSPIIEIHDETQTLLAKGSPSQIQAIQGAIEAVRQPTVRDQMSDQERRLNRANEQLKQVQDDLTAAKGQINNLNERLRQGAQEEAELRAQLKVFEAKHGKGNNE